MKTPYHSIRQQYVKGVLRESKVDRDPLRQLELWLHDAVKLQVPEPTAMVLSTAGQDQRISSRVILMKDIDESGITFFSNYESRKGKQLSENPIASLVFFWPLLERQVRIEGVVQKVSAQESDEYFASRPLSSRISAIISPQSQEIPNREWLEQTWTRAIGLASPPPFPSRVPVKTDHDPSSAAPFSASELEKTDRDPSLPASRPDYWGGYRLLPDYFEFWQGRAERLHDRLAYKKNESIWKVTRLAP